MPYNGLTDSCSLFIIGSKLAMKIRLFSRLTEIRILRFSLDLIHASNGLGLMEQNEAGYVYSLYILFLSMLNSVCMLFVVVHSGVQQQF